MTDRKITTANEALAEHVINHLLEQAEDVRLRRLAQYEMGAYEREIRENDPDWFVDEYPATL